MRLIDADVTKEALRNRIGENIDECINNVPTVDVLDKIRDEIEEERVHDDWDFGQEIFYNNAIDDVLQIIDKYRGDKE